MAERTGVITFKGNPMTLVGETPAVGKPAPNFKVTANDMSDLELASLKGKTVVISVVPSIDTPTCDIQTKRFNQEASKLGEGVKVLTISLDLPFAQRRWCGANDAKAVQTASDYKYRDFAAKYGLLIKELGLLTRAVLVVDKAGVLKHVEITPEVTKEPNYDAALAVAKAG